MTTPTEWIGAALTDLRWCITSPHTIDHIVKLQAQRNAASRTRYSFGLTDAEIIAKVFAGWDANGGSSGYSDPTAKAALSAFEDEDETIGTLHSACRLIAESTLEAHTIARHAAGIPTLATTTVANLPLDQLKDAIAHLTWMSTALPEAPTEHWSWLLREPIAGTADWLRVTAQAIFENTRAEDREPAVQKPIIECSVCSPWRTGTIAARKGMCEQCAKFQDNHKCRPNEPIVRRWEATGSSNTPPGMILEARAQARARDRDARSKGGPRGQSLPEVS